MATTAGMLRTVTLNIRRVSLTCLFVIWARVGLTFYEAPLDIRKAGEADFTRRPTVVAAEDLRKIVFEVSAPTDVEIAILNSSGRVVRHLAAGLLGPAAPPPLRANSLSQEIVWDGKADDDKPAEGAPFAARVRLGSRACLEKYLGEAPPLSFVGNLEAVTVGNRGEVYVLVGETKKFGRTEILVLDKNGAYLRTIVPYSSNTPPERTESVGHLLINGSRIPILFSGHSFSVYPLVCGLRAQTMVWHPKGYLIVASSPGTAREHGPPRYLLAFHPLGGAPDGVPFVGPKILEARDFLGGGGERAATGLDRLAISPDGQYVYLTQNIASPGFQRKCRRHGVYRVRWSDKTLQSLWLGKDEAGAGDDEFNDPAGIAVDREGKLFICDRNNNRVKIYSPDGRFLGKFDVELPEQIAVHPSTADIFVLSCPAPRLSEYSGLQPVNGKLVAHSPWKGKTERVAEFGVPGLRCMALDPESSPPRLWTVIRSRDEPQKLLPLTFQHGSFELGNAVVAEKGLTHPSFIAADPARGRVIVKEHLVPAREKPFRSISLENGKISVLDLAGADLTLDDRGNLYVMDGYGRNSLSRYDPDGKPFPFSTSGTNRIELRYRSYGPDMGLRGHRVSSKNEIYVIRSVDHGVGASLDVFGPDGRLRKEGLVAGLGGADSGLGIDANGNLYVGINVRSIQKPFPDEFVGQVPSENWVWWNRGRERNRQKPPWGYIYCNPYLWHMGAVFKFGPDGGVLYGQQGSKKEDRALTSPGTAVENAPAEAVSFKTAYYAFDVKITGAQWRYGGLSGVPASRDGPRPDPGCSCMPSHLDTDPYGRTYVPNAFMFAVDVIDSAGNRIARIGRYGNRDEKASEPLFAGPIACDFAEYDGKLYVSDMVNRRIAVIEFRWAASAVFALP